MTRREKLIEKARNNPAGIRFREILPFQDRKGMAKPYQVKQLLTVIEKYGLEARA